jgi:hypothetical protein
MPRANWKSPEGQDRLMVDVLLSEQNLGRQAETGWKGPTYQAVSDAIFDKFGIRYTQVQVQDHWSNVKHAFLLQQHVKLR